MIQFINTFLSYALLWLISAAVMVTGALLGIKRRKYLDAKAAAEAEAAPAPAETEAK
jgi:cytochrome oxidase assembly protein ShyY1